MNRVRTTDFPVGYTYTHLGLEYALQESFTRAHGLRSYASQIAIVITDGESWDPDLTAAAAKKLRDEVRIGKVNLLERNKKKCWSV